MALRTVGVRLMADVSQYTRNMGTAAKSTRDFRADLGQAADTGKLDAIADRAGVMGLALGAAAGYATKQFMDFDKQMSAVRAATHASAQEMEVLRKAAIQAGADTQYSATQAAQGVEELAKAGVSTADILAGGLTGALSLAAAGEIEVGEAAELAASAMTQFKLEGKDLPHVADLLAAGASKAQGSVRDLGQALNQSGLVAAQTGLTVEETAGTLTAFANAGLIGSDAGTSFKQMLLMLQAPSGKTRALMDELGISAYDAQGGFVGITALADQLRTKLSVLTPEVRANAMATIFGSDATRAASILYEQGAAGMQEWIDKTDDAGFAAETAAIKTDNLAGDLTQLKGSLETLAIQAGGGASGGLRLLAQAARELVNGFGQMHPVVSGGITVLTGVTAVSLLAAAAWVKSRVAMAALVTQLNLAGPAGARAAVGLQAATKWAGRAAVAFIALEAAGAVFDKLGNGAVNVGKLTTALEDYATTGRMTQGLTEAFGEDLDGFALAAQSADAATRGFWGGLNDTLSVIPGVGSAIDSMNESLFGMSFNQATDDMAALDESFTAFIATQKDAKAAGELWNRLLLKSGLDTEQFAALLPNAYNGLKELQKAAHSSADAQEDLAGELQAAEEAAEQAKEAFDDLFGVYMTSDQAAIKYQKTLADTNKTLKDGKRILDLHSEAGRDNRSAVLDMVEAIKDAREANINNGDSVEVADKKYRTQIDTLRKTLTQLGFNKKAIEALIGKYRDIPPRVSTKIETPGLPAADKSVKSYDKKLDDLARQIRTEVNVIGVSGARAQLEKLLIQQQALKKGISISAAQSAFRKNARGFAGGGWTGSGATHDEAGIVHADEWVIRKPSVRKLERTNPGALQHINEKGELPGYAGGGRVLRAPFPVNAAMARIPSYDEAMRVVIPAAPSGATAPWMQRLLEARFGLGMISGYRPGSRTLSGNRSYHSLNRAVDFPPSREMARFMYNSYKSRLKEAITPYQEYNVHNGRDRRWSGAVWNQHNFAGGNAHNHYAMINGGMIREPVFGVGRSGATYSFAEDGRSERVLPAGQSAGGAGVVVQVSFSGPVGSPYELRQWLTTAFDDLRRAGRI